MTRAPHRPPLAYRDIDDVARALRAAGGRFSAARRRVLEALFAAEGPVTADAIAAGLDGRFPSSDLASVYRNLDTLEEVGLVRHFHVAHGAGLYALAGPHQAGYVACEKCGAHRPLDHATVADVAAVLHAACGYELQLVHFPIVGRCPECCDARP